MTLLDVNVLVYAHRADSSANHLKYKAFLDGLRTGDDAFGASDAVLSGFVRVVTNPRIFKTPTPSDEALTCVQQLRGDRNFVIAQPGERHWSIFIDPCRQSHAKGNLISDAFHAALAVELDCCFATSDRDFTRFPGMKLRHPLD